MSYKFVFWLVLCPLFILQASQPLKKYTPPPHTDDTNFSISPGNHFHPFQNRVKTKTSAKYGLTSQPRLVDIIAAVPPHYRRALVPKLKAKPIRTASGVCHTQASCVSLCPESHRTFYRYQVLPVYQ